MTTGHNFGGRNRDIQDHVERHTFGDLEYVNGSGSYIRVKGTGTEDQEVINMNSGYGFNLDPDSNAEVIVMAGGSDTHEKFGYMQLPHDQQRQWRTSTGGVQNPLNPNEALEFNPDMAHLLAAVVALHANGILEVQNGQVLIRGDLHVQGTLFTNNAASPAVVPPFEPYNG